MQKNLRKGRKLLVVSDTKMRNSSTGILGFEPVMRELECIKHLFDEIIWLGCMQNSSKAAMSAPSSNSIKLILMPASGGTGVLNKIKIIIFYPIYFFYIINNLKGVTHLHSRAPSHPALIAMWMSKFMKKIICWHKYAGNWNEPFPPKSYAYQRALLKSISKKNVYGTINGKWPNQNANLISFENPCLFQHELDSAKNQVEKKEFNSKLTLLFVGNLSAFKGVKQLVNAIELLENKNQFEALLIVGDGVLKNELEILANKSIDVKVKILGALNRSELVAIYQKAHINILPSSSEGFPKVIAEGAAYGCIPVVTDVSSLGQYIQHEKNGFMLKDNDEKTIAKQLNEIAKNSSLDEISKNAQAMTHLFTYEYFEQRINKLFILN